MDVSGLKRFVKSSWSSLKKTTKNAMYNTLLTPETRKLYKYFITNHLENCSRFNTINIMDIGIGNGAALLEHHELLKKLNCRIYGVDIDEDAMKVCRQSIKYYGLEDKISLHNLKHVDQYIEGFEGILFDFILFSDSYSVIPNSDQMLRQLCEEKMFQQILHPQCAIMIYTTLENDVDPNNNISFRESIKPNLVNYLGVDFGRVIKYSHMKNILDEYNHTIKLCDIIRIPVYGDIDIYEIKVSPNRVD